MVDPVVEAAPLQRIVEVAGAVGRDDDDGWDVGLERADLGDRHRPLGEQLQEQGLELVVGPVELVDQEQPRARTLRGRYGLEQRAAHERSEEHTSELQSLMRKPYAVFFLEK